MICLKNMKQAYKRYNDSNFGIQIKVAKRYWKNPFSQPSATQAPPTKPSRPSTPSEEAEAGLRGCLPDIFNIIRNAINKLRGTQSGQQELPVALPIEVQKKALDDIQKEISQLINLLKEKRYKSYSAVEESKHELSDQRFNLYIRRRALAMPKKDKGNQKDERTLKRAMFKSEDPKLDLDPLQASQDFVFSGTDNGIVKM
ncbi:hypothetical protein EDC96DRAFT_527015 [Choanephora cucurbitarum]|nr:hypothetical protein EDC96DRAFT_527015 [Choanephora cucurbitarum]